MTNVIGRFFPSRKPQKFTLYLFHKDGVKDEKNKNAGL